MTTAILYARVSTQRQAEEELPLAGQIEQCRAKAEQLGASVARSFIDEGISGRVDSRPAFQDAVLYCETVGADYFITWSTSRFARNKIDAGLYKRRLQKAGTEIVYVSMSIDRKTEGGWVTEGVLELFDEFYSRQIAADTTRSMLKNARAGYWNGGHPPFGYIPTSAADNPARKRLSVDVGEAEVVRRIFALRLDGHGGKAIAAILNDKGIAHRGRSWHKNAVLAVLKNEAVIGNIVFGRHDRDTGRVRPRDDWVIVPSHEPIIDSATWETVQTMLEEGSNPSERGSPNSTRLFTGILHCSCGASMQIETAKGRSRRYVYYGCRARQRDGACDMRRLPAEDLDGWLLDVITDRIFTPQNLAEVIDAIHDAAGSWAKDHRKRRADVAEQVEKLKMANSRLFEIMEKFGAETPNLGDLTRRLRANNKLMRDCEQKLADIDQESPPEITISNEDVSELRSFLVETIRATKSTKRIRAFFRSFIHRIDVQGDEVRILYRPDRLVNQASAPAVHSMARSPGSWLPERRLLGTRIVSASLPARLRARAA